MQFIGVIGSGDMSGFGNMEDMVRIGAAMAAARCVIGDDAAVLVPQPQGPQVGLFALGWNCKCGSTGMFGSFCTSCGKMRFAPDSRWVCTCGSTNISTRFCTNCGKKRD